MSAGLALRNAAPVSMSPVGQSERHRVESRESRTVAENAVVAHLDCAPVVAHSVVARLNSVVAGSVVAHLNWCEAMSALFGMLFRPACSSVERSLSSAETGWI